jgi:predicted GNAT family acetyltransferase
MDAFGGRHGEPRAAQQPREEEAQAAQQARAGARDASTLEEITHERSGHRGAFVWTRDGKRLAQMTYTVAGTRVIIDHTDMDAALRGTGAGKKLVHAAVEWARKENARLMPLCPFARSVFDKTPEYSDVLAK